MRRVRKFGVSLLAGLAVGLLAAPGGASAQAPAEITVLVAPLKTGPGVNSRFGERVAEQVSRALARVAGARPLEERVVRRTLRQFNLDPQRLSLIEWRQLANRLQAKLVMFGTAERGGGGVAVRVTFVDPGSGDELPVPEFTVADDTRHQEAAARIAAGLEEQFAYQRSVVFCAEYLGSEQLDDALRNCNRALEVNPNSLRALYLRGRIYMEREEWSRAIQDLERVVEGNPSHTEALQSLAFAHAKGGDKERSLALYQEYLTFQPDAADVRLNVAFNLAQAGAFQQAMEILKEGVERDPSNAALWEYLGNVALAAGTNTAATGSVTGAGATVADTASVRLAARAFARVLELKGDSTPPTVLTNAIAANLEVGDLDAALRFSERALAALRSPGATAEQPVSGMEAGGAAGGEQSREELLATIHSLRADIYDRRNRLREAVAEMDEALAVYPTRSGWLLKRGWLKLKRGDTNAAVADYRAAVEQGADPDAIANQLFATGYNDYQQKQSYSRAIDLYRTALEFVRAPELTRQINFFTAYAYFLWATAIDRRNEEAEECGPAREALRLFRNVSPYLGRSGNYQAPSQRQIRDALDVQLFRQNQIIKAKCR